MYSCRCLAGIVAWFLLLLERDWQSHGTHALLQQAESEADEGPENQRNILGPSNVHVITQNAARQLLTTACPAAGAPLPLLLLPPSPPYPCPAPAAPWVAAPAMTQLGTCKVVASLLLLQQRSSQEMLVRA